MSESLRAELAQVLDRHDEERRAALAREQKGRDEDAQFLAHFAQLRRSVVWPAFELAATMLTERGHQASIFEQELLVGADGKVVEAEISLHVVAANARGAGQDAAARSLSISTRSYNKTVAINAGRPMEGAKGTYVPQKLDRELVEGELVKFVAAMAAA